MAKPRTIFFCSSCGTSAPKWLGNVLKCLVKRHKRGAGHGILR